MAWNDSKERERMEDHVSTRGALSDVQLRRLYDHLAALVPVVHNGATRRVRERHHAILAELSRLLP